MFAVVLLSMLFSGLQSAASDTLTLDYCYSRIENNYPLAQKIELQEQITELNKKIANTASYPQLNFSASATYQSEVTKLQVPPGGQFSGPELSKDQYKATMDVSQSIYNGGTVGIRKNLEEVHGRQQQQSTEVQLHQLKEQVNQVYFSILLAQQQLDIIGTASKNLTVQLKDIKSKVRNGVLLPDQQYILEAELIKTRQDSTDIQSNITAGYEVLSQLIGEDLERGTSLKIPETQPVYQEQDSVFRLRPEFDLFQSNRQALDYQKELAQTDKIPSLSAFGTAAYGRPGFNVFDNDLHPYYIVGLRLQWNFWRSQNAASQQQVYDLQQRSINDEEKAFEKQLNASLSKIRQQIQSLQEQIENDEKIIQLREKVVDVAASQMRNGTATATDYVTELNKATQAEMSMRMHRTELEQEKINYQTTLGISNN